jgi:CO/xanthine dehydrogenase FAD-binding subunit
MRIPLNTSLRFAMVARSPMDRPIVCAAVAQWPSGRTRVALGGFGKTPVLAMDGPEPGGAVVAAREAFRFAEDEWSSAAYRMEVAGKLVQRLVAEK